MENANPKIILRFRLYSTEQIHITVINGAKQIHISAVSAARQIHFCLYSLKPRHTALLEGRAECRQAVYKDILTDILYRLQGVNPLDPLSTFASQMRPSGGGLLAAT